MKINLIKSFLFLLLVVASFGFSERSIATTYYIDSTPQGSVSEVLADVTILGAQVRSNDNGKVHISFALSNNGGAQAQMKYAVSAVQSGDNNQFFIIDENVFDETLDIREKGFVEKDIIYNSPIYLSGNYETWITIKNNNGLTIASALAGDVEFLGDNGGIFIDTGSCYLMVEGIQDGAVYAPLRGVDINKDENLIAFCNVINNSSETTTLIPKLETFYRSIFGEKVSEKESDNTLTLEPGQTDVVWVYLEKDLEPQAYDVRLSLYDKKQGTTSNSIIFHYVLQGASATIQNVLLDKSYYKKGDVAKIFIAWSASADSFEGARGPKTLLGDFSLDTIVNDGTGKLCSDKKSANLSDDSVKIATSMEIPIVANCLNPVATVSIIDKSGIVLDEQAYSVTSEEGVEKGISIFLIGLMLLIAVIIMGIFIFIKKGRPTAGIIKMGLLVAMTFTTTSAVEAAQVVNVNFDYSPLSPTATIDLSYSTNDAYQCSNVSYQYSFSLSDIFRKDGTLYSAIPQKQLYGSYTFDVPKEPGNYYVDLYMTTITRSCHGTNHCSNGRCIVINISCKTTSSPATLFQRFDFKVFEIPPTGVDVGLRIRKGDISYPVVVVPTNDPAASPLRVMVNGVVWALKNFNR